VTQEERLRHLFAVAVTAADPAVCVPPHLPPPPKGRTIVVGAGKAAAAMARAVEDHWKGKLEGVVVTRYGHGVACERIEVIEAAHPVPDEAGLAAAGKILACVQGSTKDDLVLFLGSGGGSSLLVSPAPGITLGQKQHLTDALLKSGAAIGEINAVRKHLSRIKGGRLALAAAPAKVFGLLISDVADDDPAVIASGPTVPDATTREDALEVLTRYGIDAPPDIAAFLASPEAETPKPGDPRFASVTNVIVASAQIALEAAKAETERNGIAVVILDPAAEGDAHDAARRHAEEIRLRMKSGKPVLLLSGGEVTVKVTGTGLGGRNAEFLLALLIALGDRPDVWGLACDTDGIDGNGDNAGAVFGPGLLVKASAEGLDPRDYLARNDAGSFFEKMGALVRTGPTRTNVNDFRAILIGRD
jgi:glycerate 2-kinase